MIRNLIKVLIICAGIFTFVYINMGALSQVYSRLYSKYFPCTSPIQYSLGSIDPRFGISKANFIKTLKEAESVWETPVKKNLFEYSSTSALQINLVYDERQEATIKLQKLGVTVSESKSSYDEVKKKYLAFQEEFIQAKVIYQTQIASYEKQKALYDAEVSKWNKRGGAPEDVYRDLEATRISLQKQIVSIRASEARIDTAIANTNATVAILNRLARVLNLQVADFNTVSGEGEGQEFTAGLYQSNSEGESITIYQFDSRDKLLRVLSHEFGHALGLSHLPNPKAIMYFINEGINDKITPEDLVALKNRCKLK